MGQVYLDPQTASRRSKQR